MDEVGGNEGGRIPIKEIGIQINFCKNPECSNFGVPASSERQPRGRGNRVQDTYRIGGGTSRLRNAPILICLLCGETPPIKSNLGIAEEVSRMLAYLRPIASPGCPDQECPNHVISVGGKRGHYRKYGTTRSGSVRYLCRACGKTFSVGRPTLQQRLPHKNAQILTMLVNKVPLTRICEIAKIGPGTLYRKIDFLRQQLLLFAADRERLLLEGKIALDRLYISVDRQDHLINWTQRKDKRNTQFSAIGSADNRSGYVFGIHLNYDPDLNPNEVVAEAKQIGDLDLRPPFRRFARVWLSADLPEALQQRAEEKRKIKELAVGLGLDGEIRRTYKSAEARDDVEVFDLPEETHKLPGRGMQIHAEYTVYGHFYFLHQLLTKVGKIRFFLDQESGIRAACLGAFRKQVQDRTCDAFYVRINKTLTVNQKRKIMADLREQMDILRVLHPFDLSNTSLRRMLIADNLKKEKREGPWQDRWVEVPSPSMSEPEKQVCHLTDYGDYSIDHLAALMDKASLHGIDRFFMQVRRLLSPMERPIRTASNTGRVWQQYSAYNPGILGKLLDIFRVHYNYLKPGNDGQTPAMRLGLAKGVIEPGEVINFQPFYPAPKAKKPTKKRGKENRPTPVKG